ncbi:M23 family metallopeptidase [Phreatobacter stygius]|nr:M23 family metallopeptidase [Phreatobacter stygius]
MSRNDRLHHAPPAHDASRRAPIPKGSITFVWRSKAGLKSASLSYLACGALGGLTVALGIWGAAVSSYLVFKDDILSGLMNRQAAVQYAYEDRIRDLRAQLDRFTSRQMVDQSEVERRVDQIARRQAILESRQSIVASMSEAAGSPRGRPAGQPAASPPPLPEARPLPVGDTLRLAPPVERQSRLESRVQPVRAATEAPHFRLASLPSAAPPKADVIARVEQSLEQVELAQQTELQTLETRAERQARRIRAVLTDLGLDQARLAQAPERSAGGTGGPFLPIAEPRAEASPFERQVFRLQAVIRDHDRLNRLAATIPLGRPHAGDLEQSSGFGPRLDPFLRTWAMHSGIDFRAATGEAARATAAGKVTHASTMGGYGLMVELDHGNGISTRYAHLSRIDVSVGDMVRANHRVGRVGSTGRSTGPHLHYETRINGEAVDPLRFLRAGLRLASAE